MKNVIKKLDGLLSDMTKNVIVFGGDGLIGREVCKYLVTAQDNCENHIYNVYKADMNDTVSTGAEFIYTDILNSYSVDHTFRKVRMQNTSIRVNGEIFAIVNCTYPKPQRYMTETWYNETDNDYLTFFNQHLISNIMLCKMARQYNVENIVLLSSIYGQKVPIGPIYVNAVIKKPPLEYGMSKASINYLVKYLSKEGLHINAIAPGGLESDNMDDLFKILYKQIGGCDFTTPCEVAGMVKYLLSEEGQGITGQVITVDKGWSI